MKPTLNAHEDNISLSRKLLAIIGKRYKQTTDPN